jgi:BRCA1-associated RING domain protein 1
VPGYEENLQNLVITAGGTILKSKEELVPQNCDGQAAPKILVVYNLDSPQGCKVGEEVDILWKRLTEAQDVSANIGSQVIGHTWLLESIAACQLQPLFSPGL